MFVCFSISDLRLSVFHLFLLYKHTAILRTKLYDNDSFSVYRKVNNDRHFVSLLPFVVITRGSWYYEATVEELPEGAATRIGWAQEYANLQAPLGYDKFGYSWRSRKGTKFHESIGKSYSPGYGEGDTLGFLIVMPQSAAHSEYMPSTFKDRVSEAKLVEDLLNSN